MVRIGCLGAARITPAAIIYPAKVRGDVELTAVAARASKRAEAFARTHGFMRVERNYAALVEAADIDLVYNALPVNLHAKWTIRALGAGKHVLCEKPLAMNANEARAMLAAAETADRRLIEAFHYRYHPSFETYLEWLGGGRIGRPMRLDARFTVPIGAAGGREIRHLPETGGGAFMDLGCYPLSWTLMTTERDPEAIEASATLTARGVDEQLDAVLSFADGFEARLFASMALDRSRHAALEIVGTEGRICFENPLGPHAASKLILETGKTTHTSPMSPLSTYFYQLDAVVRALKNGDSLPTEGNAILRQQTLLDAIYDAAGLAQLRRSTVAVH